MKCVSLNSIKFSFADITGFVWYGSLKQEGPSPIEQIKNRMIFQVVEKNDQIVVQFKENLEKKKIHPLVDEHFILMVTICQRLLQQQQQQQQNEQQHQHLQQQTNRTMDLTLAELLLVTVLLQKVVSLSQRSFKISSKWPFYHPILNFLQRFHMELFQVRFCELKLKKKTERTLISHLFSFSKLIPRLDKKPYPQSN
jgi:hypothetical protein